MFYSRSLLSRKGPLGAIWVAAYCVKRLKKAQIFETNIPFSVDEILQKELDVMTYRVLSYLLLGLVRIYSKKVEYLVDDCHDMVIKINDFLVSEKSTKHLETQYTPYYSITLPDRLELDAFDLEILEDFSENNVVPHEEITLKDGASTDVGIENYSLAKYHCEEFAACHDICSADYALTEDIFLSHSMEIDMNLSNPHDFRNLEVSNEKFLVNTFYPQQRPNLDIFCGIEEEPKEPIEPFAEGHTIDEEPVKVPTTAESENGVQGEAAMEKLRDEEESLDHQSGGEQLKFPDLAQLENEMCQAISRDKDNNITNLQVSPERHLDHIFPQVCTGVEMFCRSEDETAKQVELSGEEQQTKVEQMKLMEIALLGSDKCKFITGEDPLSITFDSTTQSKLLDASGAITPEFMVVCTPAPKERAQILRKRKCCLDDVVVFPNDVMRQSIQDSTDLVSKRRKGPTALAAWKASRISNLSHGFLVPLLPCISSELRSLLCQERLKIPETVKSVEPLDPEFSIAGRSSENTVIATKTPVGKSSENMALGSSENTAIAPEAPVGKSSENVAVGSSVNTVLALETPVGKSSENLAVGSSVNMAIAPETPVGKSSENVAIGSSENLVLAPETLIGKSSLNMAVGSLENMALTPETPIGKSLESVAVGSSENTAIAPETPVGNSSENVAVGTSENTAIAPETPISRSSEKTANAPDTPIDTSSERMAVDVEMPIVHLAASRTFETPESDENAHSFALPRAHSYQTLKKELSSIKDEEFDLILMNEETNSCEADDQEQYRLSERTRMVARYLHRRFEYQKERREDETVELLQLLEEKTKKESARLFYEILALKSKGYVDVKQDSAYGDILIQKVPQWDKSCAAFCM